MSRFDENYAVEAFDSELAPVAAAGVEITAEGAILCVHTSSYGDTVKLAPNDHTKLNILALFAGDTDWLKATFPVKDGNEEVIDFDAARAAQTLVTIAGRAGKVTPP